MKKSLKILTVVLSVVFMFGALATGCQQEKGEETNKEAKLTEKDVEATKETEKEKQEILEVNMWCYSEGQYKGNVKENIVKDAIAEITGVRIVNTVYSGGDIDDEQRFNLLYQSNDLPDILRRNLSQKEPVIRAVMEEKDLAWRFTDEDLKQYCPDAYALTPELAWEVNRRPDGKHYYILDGLFDAGAEVAERYSDYAKMKINFLWNDRNWVFIRDDILKELVPGAKSYKELEDINEQRTLTWEDIHVPKFDTFDGLIDFCREVKAKYGEDIIPFSGENDRLMFDLTRCICNFPIYAAFDPMIFEVSTAPHDRKDQWEAYLKKLNGMFNEGLIDPEYALQKQDAFLEKIATGQYAVVYTQTMDRLYDGNKALIQAGEDYRYVPVPLRYEDGDFINIGGLVTAETARAQLGWVLNKKTLNEEEMKKVLGYLNYFASDDGLKMVVWGPEDSGLWTEKNGKREWVSQEFADVVAGKKSIGISKDFDYYGLHAVEDIKYLQDEFWRIGFLGEQPYHPTVEKKVEVEQAFREACAAEFTKGYWDFSFFGWNGTHETNKVFWSQIQGFRDTFAQTVMAQNDNEFDKYLENFYDVYYNKAEFDNYKEKQTSDYYEFLRKYPHKFPPGAKTEKLNQ